MRRIFSGIQPTGIPHIGNYLGAMCHWATLQDDCDNCFFCVVDQHAITVRHDPAELARSTRDMAAALLAVGIDTEKSVVFNQSMVPAHAQLAWIFNCVARMGWLGRMNQFKDKAGRDKEKASVGLFVYPNLMAADILAYQATHVPVGDDQKQHLELCRDIATKFNADFGIDLLPIVEPLILGNATRVMSLRDGTSKMSKSDPSEYARITLNDDADAIALKLRKAKTDPHPLPSESAGLEGRPEARNLVVIYAALRHQTIDEALCEVGGKTFADLKSLLTELMVTVMAPINDRMRRYLADPSHIDAVLRDGAERADAVARKVIADVYDAVGLLKPKRRGQC